MKIFIGTLNGGGSNTLLRLAKSLQKNIFQSKFNTYDFFWHIIIQGDKGISLSSHVYNELKIKDTVFTHIMTKNLGVVGGTNYLYDIFKNSNYDIFWMIDDDIEIIDDFFFHYMIRALYLYDYKTCCTEVCYFGDKGFFKKYDNGSIVNIGDHGSGCTMYSKDVFQKCGYYDSNLYQYGTDTDFNNRIKLAFGEKSLSLLIGDYTKHYNQTGTKNCYNLKQWNQILKHDINYLKNKKYNQNNIYCGKNL